MSKNLIIGIIAAVVIIGGGAAFFVTNNNDSSNSEQASGTSSSEGSAIETSNTNIAELVKKGDPRKCTFSGNDAGAEFSGTAYFANQKMYGEFKTTKDSQTQAGNMIISESSQYFWNGDTKQGVKTAVQANSSQTTSQQNQGVDPNKTFSFKCEKWTVEDAKFTPPSNVTFQDLSQLMQNMPQIGQ